MKGWKKMKSSRLKKIACAVCGLLLTACVVLSVAPAAFAENEPEPFSRSAKEFVSGITAGWNLGNTFEACDLWGNWPEDNNDLSPTDAETNWNNPVTTQEMFDKVAEYGFNAVRIPVTWYKFTNVDENGTYTIRQEWIDRVKEVVSYAQKHDMYVIVNMHHDDKNWLDIAATGEEWDAMVDRYSQVWTIIADAFKDYDEKLILEAGNEMIGNDDWWGHEDYYFEHQNQLYQKFYEIVRNSGGNNDKRYLMLPTYGAQWYSHQFEKVWFPENDDHMICDIHWYTDTTEEEYRTYFGAIANYFANTDVAPMMGECGIGKNVSTGQKVRWARNYFGIAGEYGLKCFIWDDGGDMQVLNRRTLEWVSERMILAIMETVGVDIDPSTTTTTTATTVTTAISTSTSTTVTTASTRTTSVQNILGDANGDGKVTVSDVMEVRKYVAKLIGDDELDMTAADVNKDGKVTVSDVMRVRMYVAELIDTFE